MSLITRLFRAESRPADHDDYWYGPVAGPLTAAGMAVSPETARKLSAVWRCINIIAGSTGILPLKVYRRGEVGKEPAPEHPLYRVLHDQPNGWQTSFEFREMLTQHVLLRGNAYALISRGTGGRALDLLPLHPDRVRVDQLPNLRLRYRVREQDGRVTDYDADRLLHLRGVSDDGVSGMGVLDYAREALGIGLAQEGFAAGFFGQSPQPGAAVEVEEELGEEAYDRFKREVNTAFSRRGQGKVIILENGMSWKPFSIGLTAEQAQLVSSREFTIQDIARWFGVPNHLVGETTKETSWGSGIEQMGIGFVVYTLSHWLKRWEQAISRDLIIATGTYFAEHELEALLRGDTKSRYEAYQIAAGGNAPWMSRNEIRALENKNPLPGLDEVILPLHMGSGQAPAGAGGEGNGAEGRNGHRPDAAIPAY
jgi:HK97 family phage portal protein